MTRHSLSTDPTCFAPNEVEHAHAITSAAPALQPRTWFTTLRIKTIVIVVVTQLGLIVLLYVLLQVYWLQSFINLEEHMLTTDTNRALNAIAGDVHALDMMNATYAIWDDTYAFVLDRNQSYIEKNLYDQFFLDNHLNLVLVVDPSGRVVFGKAFDLTTQREIPLPARLQQLSQRDPLINTLTLTNSITGVVQLPMAPMLVASHAIVTSEGAGPIRGALIMGRSLDAIEVQQLAAHTQLTFTIHRRDATLPPTDVTAAWTAFDRGAPLVIQSLGDDLIVANALLPDLDHRAGLLVRVEAPRSIYAQGRIGIGYFMAAFLVAGIIFGAILLALLERTLLARLAQLNANVGRIGAAGDLSLRVTRSGTDELGRLADAFDQTLATLEDVQTARAQLYLDARVSAQKYRAILDTIPDTMFQIRRDGAYLDCKAEKERMLTAYPAGTDGKTVGEVLPPDVARQLLACVEQTLQTGAVQLFEFQLVHDGQARDFEARILVSGEDEALAIVRDITERKHIERLKSEFIATVSHELRTPLTSIRGALGLIHAGVTGTQTTAMIDIAYKNSDRLLRLINDLLDIEKIESGKLEFARQPIEILPLVEQALDINRPFGAQFGVTFALEQRVADVWVNADANRLTQVLSNLLSNAAKFSPSDDTVTIAIVDQDRTIRVAVTNHGPTIPESFRERIFTKFAQADASDTRQRGGTGLGLSISKAIIEQLGGVIGYETDSATGTTFY